MTALRPRPFSPTPQAVEISPDRGLISYEASSKAGRRWSLFNSFVDKTLPQLGKQSSLATVWLVMFRHANHEGVVTRTEGQIAKDVGLKLRAVEKIIRKLKTLGLVYPFRTGYKMPDGAWGASTYQLRAIIRTENAPVL